MTEPLGQWSNAPLGYVLAAINVSLTLLTDQQAQAIHSKLNDQLPELQPGVESALAVPYPLGTALQLQSTQFWALVSESQGLGVLLRPNAIVVHATEYTDYAHFREVLRSVLAAYTQVAPTSIAQRVGLRYLDFVIPEAGESPDDYILPSMIGPRLEQFEGIGTQCKAEVVRQISQKSALRVTYARRATEPNELPLPEGLNLHSLQPSPILLRCIDYKGEIGIIDTDRWEQLREKLTVDAIIARFERLHADLSKVIRSIATAKALTTWGAGNADEA